MNLPGERHCRYCNRVHAISFDNAIRMRKWNELHFECPHCILVDEFPLVAGPAGAPVVANIDRDSPTELLERHHGALLTYGMMNQSEGPVPFRVAFGLPGAAPGQGLDVEVEDCVLRYRHDEIVHTFPVQLKRVTDGDVDPHDDLNDQIAKLAAYRIPDLIGGVVIERSFVLDWNRVVVPESQILELWLVRAGNADRTTWGLHGYEFATRTWKHAEFIYPSVLPADQTLHVG